MRVALVHDWLTGMRGGERVLEELCGMFPDASLFTLFHRPGSVSRRIEAMPIQPSPLNRLPGATRHYRYLLPLFPWAIAQFDLTGFDLIISVSHAAAKAIRKPPGSFHVCYCLTPMRFIWDMQPDYFQYSDRLRIRKTALRAMTCWLRRWDCRTSGQVDHFIADSRHVQMRISTCYGRDSEVIYPPVDTKYFTPSRDGFGAGSYLAVSALVPYKRVDLTIDAFNRLRYPLVIVGAGPDFNTLRNRAAPNIQLKGLVADEELRDLYRRSRAVIVTSREDFGLVSLEAQACGRPPVAFAAGGSLESITDGETGILFSRQEVDSLVEAVRRLERTSFSRTKLRANAERFSRENFREAMSRAIDGMWSGFCSGQPGRSGSQHTLRAAEVQSHRAAIGRPHASLTGITGAAKRCADILLSLGAILVLGLPALLVALAVRLGTPGPALFVQPRVGLGGRKFLIYKLRTMYVDAETQLGPTWAVRDDPRCTALGGVLRRYGIDELPQLWNVLRADMSLIGPRPERPEFQEHFETTLAGFRRRLEVRGGMTGLAQVRGWRGDTSVEERLDADLDYIDNWSVWKDLLILLQTPAALLCSKPRPSQPGPPPGRGRA
jgi:lipopolysaccharide/colanic/teichoic acid biosynthesis glycosyltransferase/glycosyltransferase involved in cell wall biosynthesis